MYNRYIPGSNGVYERKTVCAPQEPKSDCQEVQPITQAAPCQELPPQQTNCSRKTLPFGLDVGDVLLLCIILLLMVDSEEEDALPLLIAAAVLLFT